MKVIFFLLLFFPGFACENPFYVDFPRKKELSNEDYIKLQKEIKKINIETTLKQMYSELKDYLPYPGFLNRCSRGINQVIIDPEQNLFPVGELIKIGNGSKHCIVSFASYNSLYPKLIKDIAPALEKLGFNGYFYYKIGGYPNPSGNEIKYAAVPYAFKLLIMLEAKNLGFQNVIWVDSAILPLKDPTPLFDWIDKHKLLTNGRSIHPDRKRQIFPETQKILIENTNIDVLKEPYINMSIFGLKMDTKNTKKLFQKYYEMLELGRPFLSYFPEEFVLTALFAHINDENWKVTPFPNLVRGNPKHLTCEESFQLAKKSDSFFYRRPHPNPLQLEKSKK